MNKFLFILYDGLILGVVHFHRVGDLATVVNVNNASFSRSVGSSLLTGCLENKRQSMIGKIN